MGSGTDDFFIAQELLSCKAGNVLPLVAWEDSGGGVEAVGFVRLFHIDLDSIVRTHFRVDNLGGIVKG